jgi:hypothetical protein
MIVQIMTSAPREAAEAIKTVSTVLDVVETVPALLAPCVGSAVAIDVLVTMTSVGESLGKLKGEGVGRGVVDVVLVVEVVEEEEEVVVVRAAVPVLVWVVAVSVAAAEVSGGIGKPKRGGSRSGVFPVVVAVSVSLRRGPVAVSAVVGAARAVVAVVGPLVLVLGRTTGMRPWGARFAMLVWSRRWREGDASAGDARDNARAV